MTGTLNFNGSLSLVYFATNQVSMRHTMLCLNRNTNKQAVAREKILQYHSLARVNFVPLSLPIALAWVDKSNSCRKLSQMYNILRKEPDIIQNSQKKRKAQKIE